MSNGDESTVGAGATGGAAPGAGATGGAAPGAGATGGAAPGAGATGEPEASGRMPVRYVGRGATIVMTTFFAVISVFLLYSALALWPVAPPESLLPFTTTRPPARGYLLWTVDLDIDRSYFVVVVLGGAIGAMLYVLRSFAKYVGTRSLTWSWVPKYLLMPVQGAILAAIMYIVLRAGFLTGPVSTDGNPFGFVAVAVLVGLFSEQAVGKLKDAMETLLTPAPTGPDPVAVASPDTNTT